ncbi:hypothetical protein [Marinicella meishanensis]|uniref:hypothetical protein n=1 Tax=Marinicella meishanensis TaxID=2873263 RepID=UPI001CBE8EEB|nr:hypothetical protein [Marinicella sp. NBU2979]
MITKPVTYWALSLALLMTCLLLPAPATNRHDKQTALDLKSHLDVEPRFFYYRDNRFHARVLGTLRIDIEPDKLPAHLSHYHVLEFKGLDLGLDVRFSLNWSVNGVPHRVPINQTSHSLTPFDFQTSEATAITDLHLLLEANHELGNVSRFERAVTFQSIAFTQANIGNQWAINRSEWMDLTAVKFSSINGYTASQDPHLKGLIQRLGLWLLLSALLLTGLKLRPHHLLYTLLIGWLLPTGIYLNNHWRQHQQLAQAFSEDPVNLNQLDQEARQLAQAIKRQLPLHPNPSAQPQKLILVGPKDFFHLRLMRHLFDHNVALDSGFSRMLAQTDDRHVFVLSRQAWRFCEQPEQHEWLKGQVTVLHLDRHYCLMRKV